MCLKEMNHLSKKRKVWAKILGMIFIICIPLLISFVSAGVGIKWDRESALVNEGEKTCLTYSVYNPWPEETYASIEPSDELKGILVLQEAETKLVPANTASNEAIPIQFCFKIPEVYEKDCWIGGKLLCKQDCAEEQKIYSGEVVVKSVASPNQIDGVGGSSTTMSVSAPLNIKVRCNAHSRNFTLVYIILIVFSLTTIGILLYRKYKKPKLQRDKEKLKRIKEKIKKERNK
jgi:hypothetical protein